MSAPSSLDAVEPIYQTITGEIQCVMHEGRLMVREWPRETNFRGANPFPWEEDRANFDEAMEQWRLAEKGSPAAYRAGCRAHCLAGRLESPWRMKPRSQEITEQIEALMAEREEALAAETADRPGGTPRGESRPCE